MNFGSVWFDNEELIVDTPLLNNIRAAVLQYRQLSPFHHALHIPAELHQDENGHYKVEFNVYGRESILRRCRFQTRKGGKTTERVEILEHFGKKKKWVSVKASLPKHFDPDDANVSLDTLRAWWEVNGKTFNWTGLPTELKEHVLQFCIWQPVPREHLAISELERRLLPYEILNIFGHWRSLLSVSQQVRTLSLRLVMNSNMHFPGGFGLFCDSHGQFRHKIKRLSKYYQMVKPDGVPKNARMERHAYRYLRFPKLHPSLDQYATFAHGIRRLSLGFRLLECFYFFKVSVGGIDKYRPPRYMTCDILEQLPNLNGLCIKLPHDWREFMVNGPFPIYHERDPCPRTMIRWIYERVAEVVAPYKKVNVFPLVDEAERQNFWNLREACQLSWNITKQELEELYEDCEGGISLDDYLDNIGNTTPYPSVSEHDTVLSSFIPARLVEIADDGNANGDAQDALPPRCKCAVSCRQAFVGMKDLHHRANIDFNP